MDDTVKFWGAATVGVKGQIVIPAEARERYGIKEGDKVIFFTPPGEHGKDSIMVIKAEVFEKMLARVHASAGELLEQTKNINKDN